MTDTTPDTRDALPFWQARSTYAAVAAVIYTAFLVAGDPEGAEEAQRVIPAHLEALVAAGLALWAYVERLLGKMRVVL